MQDAAEESQILISEFCFEQVKESFRCAKVGAVVVKNKANPITIYKVLE